jgi:hypothetical protein
VLAFNSLPTNDLVNAHSARSVAHFFKQVEKGEHEGGNEIDFDDW